MNTEDRVRRIDALLRENLAATDVQIVDESHKHRGHAGAAAGGGHFRVSIVSPRFAGLSPVQSQRLVYQALGDMMTQEIHALTITTHTE